MNFTFASTYLLLLLLLLPCFFLCKSYTKKFYFPKMEWIKRESSLWSLNPWIKVAIFSLMIFAIAQPYTYDTTSNNHKKGRDLVLALDASGSMAQSSYNTKEKYKTKYETMLQLSQNFIRERYDDNIGVVVFGTFAYTASPLTYDIPSLSYLLGLTTVGIAGESTAIGDAIVQSINTLSFGKAKNKVIVLLTDGYHNAGKHSPKEAVALAKEKGIKVYTIGIGKSSEYDVGLMQTIAKESGAKSYQAQSASALKKIYEEIESLEPSAIRSENFLNKYMLFFYPLTIAFALLLFWILLQRRENIGNSSIQGEIV